MKLKYLFPHRFKKVGWMILIPGLALGIYSMVNGFDSEQELFKFFNSKFFVFWSDELFKGQKFFRIARVNLFNTIVGSLVIIGGMLVAFSRQKEEDEFVAKIRLESLVWATYVNYAVLFIANLFVYGIPFFNIMTINLFTILIFFIFRFNWELMKLKKSSEK